MIKNGVSVCRLAYTDCVTYKFPKCGKVARFTGSSLNKKRYAKPKNEDENSINAKKKVRRKNSGIVDVFGPVEPDIFGHDKNSKSGIKRNRRCGKTGYFIGKNAKQLIRKRGVALWRSGRCKTFVTLSFIAPVGDKIALRCLQNYVRSWRKEDKNINYLWVAERQENGNVHFHILSSRYYDIEKENNRWVRVQYNAGLSYRDECGFEVERWEIECLIRGGILKKHLNPFDVKRVKTQSGVISYMTKYMTKSPKRKDKNIDGFLFHPWRCSHRVSKVFTGILAQKETGGLMFSDKNERIQYKDYIDKQTGKLKYPKGYTHRPVPYFGMWANKISVYDFNLAGGQYRQLDEINKKILINGTKPEIEYICEYDFYNEFCIPVTLLTLEMINEPAYHNPHPVNDAEKVYWDNKRIYSYHPDIVGRLPEPGNYHLKDGSYYRVGRYTDEELKFLNN